jgi:hypothetical protein
MAGKLNSGVVTGGQLARKEAKAYTEGRQAKIAGLTAGNNPHPATSPAGVAWLAGLNQYVVAGTIQNRDHAAEVPRT